MRTNSFAVRVQRLDSGVNRLDGLTYWPPLGLLRRLPTAGRKVDSLDSRADQLATIAMRDLLCVLCERSQDTQGTVTCV
jgi:hypothetical protein